MILLEFILNGPVNNFSVVRIVSCVQTSIKQRIKCLAQRHSASGEAQTSDPWSQVKHSITAI